MKGLDCTHEQLESASDFMTRIAKWPADRPSGTVSRDDVVRLLAWYGALRFIGARDKTGGTLEKPGHFDVVKREAN